MEEQKIVKKVLKAKAGEAPKTVEAAPAPVAEKKEAAKKVQKKK